MALWRVFFALVVLLVPSRLSGFHYTNEVIEDVTLYANITASHTCNATFATLTCNLTCPTRSAPVVDFDKALSVKDPECWNVTDGPGSESSAVVGNGHVVFGSGADNCTTVNKTLRAGPDMSFTLTMWLKHNCTGLCELFRIGTIRVALTDAVNLTLNDVSTETVLGNDWHFLTLRFNAYLSWFVDGKPDGTIAAANLRPTTTSPEVVSLGPGSVLPPGEAVEMVDARWYRTSLTDREIPQLFAGDYGRGAQLQPVSPVDNECRCPGSQPTLLTDTGRYTECSDNLGATTVIRAGASNRHAMFAIDSNNATLWNSGVTFDNVSFTLTLGKQYQMKHLTVFGMTSWPAMLSVNLRLNDILQAQHHFLENCTGALCQPSYFYDPADGVFSFDLESLFPVGTIRRSDYEQLLADTVQLVFHSRPGTAASYTVAEITLTTRCDCSGVGQCSVDKSRYTCTCDNASHTDSEHCDTCQDAFYRPTGEDFQCPESCHCDAGGSEDHVCNKVAGQCPCKGNTEGRACNLCKHNTVDLGSNSTLGCQTCPCNSLGTIQCTSTSNVTDFLCMCKANVESDTGNCMECRDGFYNLTNNDGCQHCSCHPIGTTNYDVSKTCNKSTGQCPCKAKVTGLMCDQCMDEYWNLNTRWTDGCQACRCSGLGALHSLCDKASGQCNCRGGVTPNLRCEPGVTETTPLFGPIAGGTMVTITGHLLAGTSSMKITMAGVPAAIANRTENLVLFHTTGVGSPGTVSVFVDWNSGEWQHDFTFTFKPNPAVTIPAQNIATFASGGCSIQLDGSHFDSVADPRFLVHLASGAEPETTSCSHWEEKLVCVTPSLQRYMQTSSTFQYGLYLDGLHQYTTFPPTSTQLLVVPDPLVHANISQTLRNSFDKTIAIKGSGFTRGCVLSDIRVTVGDMECPVDTVHLTDTEIRCNPGESFPGTNRKETITVFFGTMSYQAGTVTFTSFWALKEFIYIAIGAGCFLVVILVIIALVCVCRRRRKNKKINRNSTSTLELMSPAETPKNNYISVGTANPLNVNTEEMEADIAERFIGRLQAHVGKAVKSSLVDRSHVELRKHCTKKGSLTRIINGVFSDPSAPFSGQKLTIKTLVDSYSETDPIPAWLNEGLYECTRLRDALNGNVLRLMGIAVDKNNVYVLYPEMEKRSLKDMLRISGPSLEESVKLDLCVQVAEGMDFLHSEHIVHKDLAARNCMVDSESTVKIADAAFSCDLYPEEYLLKHGRRQPVRWMAPESLQQAGFYHSKSDIWSFGVLVWEVFTDGCLPFQDIDNTEVPDRVCKDGFRLAKPYECPNTVFTVIEKCHDTSSESRPNFFLIINFFTDIISPPEPSADALYVNTSMGDTTIYANNDAMAGPPIPTRIRRP